MTAAPRLRRHLPLAVALTPLLVAAGRAVADHWYPVGDNAFFALRARDVGTAHHPLLGTWTSASLTVGTRLNNPGPLLFDVLALPARLSVSWGVVLGVVLMHVVAIAVAIHWARRAGGMGAAWAVALAYVGLEWAMGSAILVEPWQPHALLPPVLCLLVLAWALVADHPGALPWAAGAASLIVQTHLSYAVLVPGLALVGVLGFVVPSWRSAGRSATWTRLRVPLLATGIVLAVAWAQPLVDQVAGTGNLVTVVSNGGGGGETAGATVAGRVMATAVAVPGGWSQHGFTGVKVVLAEHQGEAGPPPLDGLASTRSSVGWSLVALGVFGAAVVVAARRRSRVWGSGLFVAASALGLAFVTISLLPVSDVLGLGAHQVRFAWPVAWFTIAVVVGTFASLSRRLAVVPIAMTAVLAVLALPAHNPRSGVSDQAWAMPYVRDLVGQVDDVDLKGPVLVDLSVIHFAEPYSTPVMLELQRKGVEFVVDDQITVGQLGDRREHHDDDPITAVVRIVDGKAASHPAAGWTRVAYVEGPDAARTAAVLVREER